MGDACKLCVEGFTKAKQLRRHLKTHTQDSNEDDQHQVIIELLNPESSQTEHNVMGESSTTDATEKPWKQKLYKCKTCKKRFPKIEYLRVHKLDHKVTENTYKCNICSDIFTDQNTLKQHQDTHKHKCTVCNKLFAKAKVLKGHMRTHSGERPYKCTLCPKAYVRSNHLKDHMFSHSGEKPHKCEVCSKHFGRLNYLKEHMMSHINMKLYSCDICKKQFTYSGSLKRHLLTHTTIKDIDISNKSVYAFSVNNDQAQNSVSVTAACNETVSTSAIETDEAGCGSASYQTSGATQRPQLTVLHNVYAWEGGMLNALQNEDMCVDNILQNTSVQHTSSNNGALQIIKNFVPQRTTNLPVDVPSTAMPQTVNSINHHPNHSSHTIVKKPIEISQVNETENKAHHCSTCNKSFTRASSLKIHNLIHLGIKPHKCKVCDKEFTQVASLKQHMLTHSEVRAHQCSVCNKLFNRAGNLKTHMVVHSGEKPFKCDTCGKCYSRSQHLKAHVITHQNKNKQHKCNVCNQVCSDFDSLKMHMNTHLSSECHKCVVCEKTFSLVGHLKRHIILSHKPTAKSYQRYKSSVKRACNANKPFKCAICNKGLAREREFHRHMLIHYDLKPHKCSLCDKAFRQPSGLKTHLLIHSGTKAFSCYMCSKSFFTRSHLNAHMETHSVLKTFKCNICDKGFTRAVYLKDHIVTHEEKRNKPHKCTQCGKCFAKPYNLKSHQETHTGTRRYKCELCPNAYSRGSHLKEHMLIHQGIKPFKCTVCSKAFVRNSKLKDHMKIHSRRVDTFTCDQCPRTFTFASTLKRHMQTHLKLKPYNCPVCSKSFTLMGNLKKHVKMHGAVKDAATTKESAKQKPDNTNNVNGPVNVVTSNTVNGPVNVAASNSVRDTQPLVNNHLIQPVAPESVFNPPVYQAAPCIQPVNQFTDGGGMPVYINQASLTDTYNSQTQLLPQAPPPNVMSQIVTHSRVLPPHMISKPQAMAPMVSHIPGPRLQHVTTHASPVGNLDVLASTSGMYYPIHSQSTHIQ